MKYFIDELYKYIDCDKTFRLKTFHEDRGIFEFHCGHCVTDNVFEDLVRVRTGVQVIYDTQLELF